MGGARAGVEHDAEAPARAPRWSRSPAVATTAPHIQRMVVDPARAAAEPVVFRGRVEAALASATEPLPHVARLQPAFGPHDLSAVRAAIGGEARRAGAAIGAAAFTSGDRVGFRDDPSLWLAAHESAHVVQQRAGIALPDGIGRPGDEHEQRADAVADAVVAGGSAAWLLGSPREPREPRDAVQMFPWAHTQHPRQPAYPSVPHPHPPAPTCDPAGLAAIHSEVVELQGTPTFDPSPLLAAALECTGGGWVNVRFGTLAHGRIEVVPRRLHLPTMTVPRPGHGTQLVFDTVRAYNPIELHHPAFPGRLPDYPPRLELVIDSSVVTGGISFFPGAAAVNAIGWSPWLAGYTPEAVFGWRGIDDLMFADGINELRDGVLRYRLDAMEFSIEDRTTLGGSTFDADNALGGDGSFEVVDAAETFDATATITGPGVVTGTLPLRKVEGRISGTAEIDLDLAPVDAFGGRFEGNLHADFAGGLLTVVGTARYRSRRASGSLTIMFAPRPLAWQRVAERLAGSPNAPTSGALTTGYAIVGWGTVDFALNEWLRGSVSAVVDPDGFITSYGILRPSREFQFLTDRERTSRARQIADLEGSVTFIPVLDVFEIGGHATAEVFAEGRVGPGRVYGLEVDGTFSTRPGSVFEARATGRINLSAWARLRAELSSGIHFSVAGDIVRLGSVDIVGTAAATVRAYVELQPTFERIVDPAHPDTASYRIRGALTAAGTADLDLSGRIVVKVAGARVWSLDLGRYQWNLGSLGMTATIEHTLGSHDPIALDFSSAEFDDGRFGSTVENLLRRRGERQDHRRGDAVLDQDAATVPAPVADTPTHLRHGFTMSGVPHELWVAYEPQAVIKMSSPDPDRAADKVEAEHEVVEAQEAAATGPRAGELDEQGRRLERIEGRLLATEAALDALDADARTTTDPGVRECADELQAFGDATGKTGLSTPSTATPEVEIVRGRYVVTTLAQVTAVRAIAPSLTSPPPDLDAELTTRWNAYVPYFTRRLAKIERDLNRTGSTSERGPRTWSSYIASEIRMAEVRGAKDFQPELRRLVMDANPGVPATSVDIDVGVVPTRRGVSHAVRFADVVMYDAVSDSVEIYSAKVHDLDHQAAGRTDAQVEAWIDETMATEVEDAATYYGHEIEFRRPYVSDTEGHATERVPGRPAPARHALYERTIYVSQVHLIWQYSAELVPARFIEYIRRAGARFGVTERRRRQVQVTFELLPRPPIL